MKNENATVKSKKKILDKRAVKMIPSLDGKNHNTIYLEQLEKLSIHAYEENKNDWKRYKLLIRSSPLFSLTFGVATFLVWIFVLQITGNLFFTNILMAGSISLSVGSLFCLVLISILTYKCNSIEPLLLDVDAQLNSPNKQEIDKTTSAKGSTDSKTKIIVAVIGFVGIIGAALVHALL